MAFNRKSTQSLLNAQGLSGGLLSYYYGTVTTRAYNVTRVLMSIRLCDVVMRLSDRQTLRHHSFVLSRCMASNAGWGAGHLEPRLLRILMHRHCAATMVGDAGTSALP